MEIASSGNLLALRISGAVDADEIVTAKCLDIWEQIVKQNGEENGNYEYDNYFNTYKSCYRLTAEYVQVKSMLISLVYKLNWTYIHELRDMGYNLAIEKIGTVEEQNTNFANSLSNALKKVENLTTKITSKRKEIETMFKEGNGKGSSYMQLLASINASLGFTVDKDISLSMFNEYKKILKTKFSRKE